MAPKERAMQMTTEKREFTRTRCDVPVMIGINGEVSNGTITDRSFGGLGIHLKDGSTTPWANQTIEIMHRGALIGLRVTWSSPDKFGGHFLEQDGRR